MEDKVEAILHEMSYHCVIVEFSCHECGYTVSEIVEKGWE